MEVKENDRIKVMLRVVGKTGTIMGMEHLEKDNKN